MQSGAWSWRAGTVTLRAPRRGDPLLRHTLRPSPNPAK